MAQKNFDESLQLCQLKVIFPGIVNKLSYIDLMLSTQGKLC